MARLVPPTNLRESVIAQLRSQIVSGAAAPGMIYSVPSLANELGVSTTPVREALLELSRSGLVEPLRNRGFRVQAITLQDLENHFDVRVMLESGALSTLAHNGLTDTAPLIELADVVAQAVKDEDVGLYIESDRCFHEALIARAGNPLLTRMIMNLRADMRLYGIHSAEGKERQRASVSEHYEMIELAATHQCEAITALITRHIESWKPLFAASLQAASSAE
ncbi:GntR family transcriptional regulator [Advenella sp. S44]|uniref:GntR family transcriptional regulator n=1 Tax=Advenella sp. S44 TaxID=1982755 RepID=UPI000CB8C34A|nr:GntR family transcriptional regulator [Advenella sp. S44]PJX21053.1 GntR family transcriptional regulator [Advenella sp. S44]